MRLRMGPLPPEHGITARVIIGGSRRTMSRMSLVRTWRACGTRQVGTLRRRRRRRRLLLLLLLLTRRLTIRIALWQRLPVGTVHGRRRAHAAPDRVRRYKSLRLGRNRGEDAVLVKPHAVAATAVVCGLEPGASNLEVRVSKLVAEEVDSCLYLAPSAVSAGNGSSLSRCWGLAHVARRRLRCPVWVGRRGRLIPFLRAWETVGLLSLVVVGGHVRTRRLSRLCSRRRREGRIHLGAAVVSTYIKRARGKKWAGAGSGSVQPRVQVCRCADRHAHTQTHTDRHTDTGTGQARGYGDSESDLHEAEAGRSRVEAAARSEAASGEGADLGCPGGDTWLGR